MQGVRNTPLDLTRVLSIFFIMLIHTPQPATESSQPVVFMLKLFLAGGAVPVFFMLSGYLGARKTDSPDTRTGDYLRDKFRTLIFPYLFWNTTVMGLVFLLKLTGWDSAFRGNGIYFDVAPTATSIGARLLGIGCTPIVYQFWFLRDLIVVSLVSFFFIRHAPKILLLPWMCFFLPFPQWWSTLPDAFGFYLLGRQLHHFMPPEKFPSRPASLLYCAVWLLIGIGMLTHKIPVPGYPLARLGSAAFLFLLSVSLARYSVAGRLAALGPAIFFIYATHEPLQTIFFKTWQSHHLPAYDGVFSFLAVPVMVFALSLTGYWIWNLVAPRFLSLVTGGRSSPRVMPTRPAEARPQ